MSLPPPPVFQDDHGVNNPRHHDPRNHHDVYDSPYASPYAPNPLAAYAFPPMPRPVKCGTRQTYPQKDHGAFPARRLVREYGSSSSSDTPSDVDSDDDLEPKPFDPSITDDSTRKEQVQSVSAASQQALHPVLTKTENYCSRPIKPSPFKACSYDVIHSSFTGDDQDRRDSVVQLTVINREPTSPPTEDSLFHWMYVGPSNLTIPTDLPLATWKVSFQALTPLW